MITTKKCQSLKRFTFTGKVAIIICTGDNMLKKLLSLIEKEKEPILLVTDKYNKEQILTNLYGDLVNITFISLPELIKKLTFSYSHEAIYYLMKQYQVNYEIALTYLQNMKYLSLINPNDDLDKINLLQTLYEELFTNKLIAIDNLFLKYCQKKQVLIYGYPYISKEDLKVLSKIKYQYLSSEKGNINTNEVSICKTVTDELFYVLEAIGDLITQGVPLTKIKLIGIRENDYFLTKQMFKLYQIPLNLHEKKSLYSYDITKDLLKAFGENRLDSYDYQGKERSLINEVISIINQFASLPVDDILLECLKQTLSNTYITEETYQEAVEVIPLEQALTLENHYLFLLGFNQGHIPTIHKDEDYFSDAVKQKNHLSTSSDLNYAMKEMVIKVLSTPNHFYLSYHTEEENPSALIEELKLTKKVLSSNYYSLYSPAFNELLLVKYLDNYIKYGTKSEALLNLVKTYPIPYLQYNNAFTGIKHDDYLASLKQRLLLSYTAIDTYYKCGFMYYLKKVLKLEIFNETFVTFIGSLYHKILSCAFNETFDFEKEYQDYLATSTYELNYKEKFLLVKLKAELVKIIAIIKDQAQYINYNQTLYEENFNIKVHNPRYPHFDITFTGYIDKIWYHTITDEDGNEVTYVSIVDYKTGKLDIKLDLVPYGLSLQLPVYVYLARHSNLPNVKVYGFFLQNILQNELKADNEEEYLAQKQKALQLSGYIIDDVPAEAEFDKSKSDSKIIKNLRLKKDGTYYAHAKVLTSDALETLIKTVEDKINEASTEILNANFAINPKINKGVNLSCMYCTFKDICYKAYKDYIHLEVGDDDD
jgi:ATP-dependent helicase/DNAse subunit B